MPFRGQGVGFLALDRELLSFRDIELLRSAILKAQGHGFGAMTW
jgi:hypothetical protein